ncbi:MAG: DegV family protein [Ruminococcaceae bacterium]|nr:DegV family protein [Oscillospiraceae bacterium]
MTPYVIVTDSSADLPATLLEQYEIVSVPLAVTLEGQAPVPNDKIDIKEFYATLRAKKSATTSAVAIESFKTVFERYVRGGTDVLYLGFSSGLSGTYNAAFIAARELKEQYPERTVATVDTLCASLGQGLLVYLAAKKRAEGADLNTVRCYVEDNKLNLCHWFTVDDLFFLKRGGRISAITAVAGSMLQIKPVMHVDNAGHLVKVNNVRGRKGSLEALCSRMKETAIDPAEQTVFISHGDCEADANYLADRIRETMGVKNIVIGYVGPVIGAHAGPGVVALFFLGKER